MAIMDVVLYPDDPLTRKAQPFAEVDAEVARLVEDMYETMYAYDGVGLAGPQVGIDRRILVLHEPEGRKMCLINPEIDLLEGHEYGEEGCLSLPNVFASVPRATRIRVRAVSERGKEMDFEATDFLARVIQHEYDHLEGIVFPDRLDMLTRELKLREWDEMRRQLSSAARKG